MRLLWRKCFKNLFIRVCVFLTRQISRSKNFVSKRRVFCTVTFCMIVILIIVMYHKTLIYGMRILYISNKYVQTPQNIRLHFRPKIPWNILVFIQINAIGTYRAAVVVVKSVAPAHQRQSECLLLWLLRRCQNNQRFLPDDVTVSHGRVDMVVEHGVGALSG